MSNDSSSVGQPLGSGYVLQDRIGTGAMGEVWKADGRDGDQVAIKVLKEELTADGSVVNRFLQEAQLLKGIRHPHVVGVRDLVAENGRLAIVMDLVAGSDLRSTLTARGTLPAAEATQLTCDVLGGLQAVHEADIVHRDLKPENVLMDNSDGAPVPRISDFGIARIVEEGPASRSTAIIGTPEYMAPELADGETPTPRSDLYAVGIILYELLAGVTPFAGGAPLAVLRRQSGNLPGRPDGIPDDLWGLVSRLLSKNPADRPASAAAVAGELVVLQPALAGVPALTPLSVPPEPVSLTQQTMQVSRPVAETPPPEGPRKRFKWWWAAIPAALLLLAVPIAVFSMTGPADTNSTEEAAVAGSPSASPSPSETPSESPSPTQTTTPTPTETPTPTPTGPVVVPSVVGEQLSDATITLEQVGLEITTKEVIDEQASDNQVVKQEPAAGQPAPKGKVTLHVARRAVGVWLADQECIEGSTGTGTTKINAREYTHTLGWKPTSTPFDCQFDLSRNYKKLTAVVGLQDNSQSSAASKLEISVDGRVLFSKVLKLGKSYPVELDVSGALRVRFYATRLDDDFDTYVGIGDPQVWGFPKDLPSPSPSSSES